jgi:mono/diheme cytochrome c family protein
VILKSAFVVLAVAGGFLSTEAHAQDEPKPAARSTKDGVYSEAQAARGETVYKASCLECHVPADYTDEAFKSKFVGGSAFDMYDLIKSSMPQNNPGSLSNTQYADVVAYLFKLNGLPTGKDDLPVAADSLKAIKVEAKAPSLFLTLTTPGVRRIHGSSRIR